MENLIYKHIINSPHHYVVKKDLLGRYTYINPTFAKKFSFLARNLVGEIFDLTVYEKDVSKLNSALSKCITSPEETVSVKIRKKGADGGFWWVQWDMSAIKDENDNVCEILCIGHDITESQTNSLRILEYAKRVNMILDGITDGFYTVDSLWTITKANRAFGQVMGMKASELKGKNLWELFPPNGEYASAFRKTMNEKIATRFEQSYKKQYFVISAYPSMEGITVFFQDITEQKKQEEELRQNIEELGNTQKILRESLDKANQLAMIVSNTTNLVVLTDAEGYITWVNEAFHKVTGYSIEEAIGKKPGYFLQGEETDKETVANISQAIREQREIDVEILNYTKAGKKYWLELKIQPIFDSENSLSGFMAIESVITERREHEQQIIHRNQLLEEIAFIQAHEVRRPVANILGLINLIRGEEDPYSEIITTYLNYLEVAAKDLDDVIHRIVFKTNEAD